MSTLPFPPGVIAVIRTATTAEARTATAALLQTDVCAIEITLTVPGALEVVQEFAARDPRIGIGTLRTAADAQRARDSGAAFAVSPHLDAGLTGACATLGLPYVPGVATPSELQQALTLGAKTAKLFPISSLGGPRFVRAIAEPFPEAAFIVSGGIQLNEVTAYLEAGAVGVCLGRALLDPEALLCGDTSAAASYARAALASASGGTHQRGGDRARRI